MLPSFCRFCDLGDQRKGARAVACLLSGKSRVGCMLRNVPDCTQVSRCWLGCVTAFLRVYAMQYSYVCILVVRCCLTCNID